MPDRRARRGTDAGGAEAERRGSGPEAGPQVPARGATSASAAGAPAEGALAKVESPASGPPPDPSDAMLRGAGSLVSELPLHINGSKGKFEGDESGLSDGAEDLDAEIEAFRAKLAVTPLPPKSGRFSPANRVGLRGKG